MMKWTFNIQTSRPGRWMGLPIKCFMEGIGDEFGPNSDFMREIRRIFESSYECAEIRSIWLGGASMYPL